MNRQLEVTGLINTLRTTLDQLEQLVLSAAPQSVIEESAPPVFDPDTDQPPVTPTVDGNRTERDWVSLMLWAQLRAINVRQGRGATPEESVQIAKTAGYRDGRAWNQWTGWIKDDEGGRWVTEDPGMAHMQHFYAAVGRAIPADLA